MKKSKLITSLIIILIISMLGTTVVGAIGFSNMIGAAQSMISEPLEYFSTRSDVPQQFTISIPTIIMNSQENIPQITSCKKQVFYTKTLNNSQNNHVDLYIDNSNNEYAINMRGDIIGFYAFDHSETVNNFNTVSRECTDRELIEIANNYLYELFGDGFKNYNLVEAKYKLDTDSFYCRYAVKKGAYYTTDSCIINLNRDGSISNFSCVNTGEFENLDSKDANSIIERELLSYVDYEIKTLYPQKLIDYDIYSIVWETINGKYLLKILVSVQCGESEMESEIYAQVIYYEK